MRFIKLFFDAPLQSWGDDSRWDYRGTYDFPTKSGVVGLLGCCLGYPRNDRRLNELSDSIRLAVRADEPGSMIKDYQTAQSLEGKFLNSEGKGRCDTLLLPRSYLQNAKFTVFIWGEQAMLDKCYDALLHPHWTSYLGRKTCVPAVPLVPIWVDGECIDDVIRSSVGASESGSAHVQIEMQPDDVLREDERMLLIRDNVICSTVSEYAARRVRASFIQYGGNR